MNAASIASRQARLDVLLDGIRITRSDSEAARRGTEKVILLGWEDVLGATVEKTSKGREVVRVAVVGVPTIRDHRDDPFAVKAGSGQSSEVASVVEMVNREAGTRRQWRETAERAAGTEAV